MNGAMYGKNQMPGDTPVAVDADGNVKIVPPATELVLAALAARTASANGDAFACEGNQRFALLFNLTVADTDAGDTLDVFIDVSPDGGTTWINAIHFAQVIGTDAASKAWAVLDSANPGVDVVAVTSDAAAGKVRPGLFGTHIRARWAIVDAGAVNASFTFSVKAFAQ
jgi:hypothetical protein